MLFLFYWGGTEIEEDVVTSLPHSTEGKKNNNTLVLPQLCSLHRWLRNSLLWRSGPDPFVRVSWKSAVAGPALSPCPLGLARSRGAPGSPGRRLGFPGAGRAQALPSSFPETFLTIETSGGLQPFPKVYSWLFKAAELSRPGAHVPGSSELFVGRVFQLTSRQRADRPGNGYWPKAAGERLIQSWKGALVVKPFNGLSPMIISPGLELANSEPL